MVLDFPDPGPFDKPIVRVINASFSYNAAAAGDEAPPLLSGVDFQVGPSKV